MMTENRKFGVLRPEVQGSEDRGGSPFEGGDLLYGDSARIALRFIIRLQEDA